MKANKLESHSYKQSRTVKEIREGVLKTHVEAGVFLFLIAFIVISMYLLGTAAYPRAEFYEMAMKVFENPEALFLVKGAVSKITASFFISLLVQIIVVIDYFEMINKAKSKESQGRDAIWESAEYLCQKYAYYE